MFAALRSLGLQLLLCAALAWLLWRWQGPIGLALSAAVFGLALARPLVDLAAAARHHVDESVWRDVSGHHAAYRGHALRVFDDDRHVRWLRVDDLRALLPGLPSDAHLRRIAPAQVVLRERPAGLCIEVEALIDLLRPATAADTLRLRHWLERELAFPARRRREILGVRPLPPDDTPPTPT